VILAAALTLHLLPKPASVAIAPCAYRITAPLHAPASFDRGAREEIDERWRALHLPALRIGSGSPSIHVVRAYLTGQHYRLNTQAGGNVTIEAGDADGVFYAAMTLAQLPVQTKTGWVLPCVAIDDAPALKWRILSDDVSRGPLPTMRYFEERIRTIAAFKMNGYSPYMEHVFVDPHDPLPAPLDGITPAQLHELSVYAARFHVAFIPEQQTLAHMHNTLKYEKYSSKFVPSEFAHGFLLSPSAPAATAYAQRLIRDELAAVPHPPFFHIGSDESTVNRAEFEYHVRKMNDVIAPSGARIMFWDDAIEKNPMLMRSLPRSAVIINWHYGNEQTFEPYIRLIASGGFEQMVASGAGNWNEIFPDLDTALPNEERFIGEGKAAHVLGSFQTEWNDDGQTLFEATWYPILYGASNAWERGDVDQGRFAADFPAAFFGRDDPQFPEDVKNLAIAQTSTAHGAYEGSDYFLWSDPFNARVASRLPANDLRLIRWASEAVEEHFLKSDPPPLHANAARVMFLAARMFDVAGRKYQAAAEMRAMYEDAQRQTDKATAQRDLYWCKYWAWELRDDFEELAPLYEQAWRYEDRDAHLESNLDHFHVEAQRYIRIADRLNEVTFELFAHGQQLPDFDAVLNAGAP
jgi:hexosaminidase